MNKTKTLFILFGFMTIGFINSAKGFVEIKDISQPYTQNFDSLASTSSSIDFFPDETIPGWRGVYSTNGVGSYDVEGLFNTDGSNYVLIPWMYSSGLVGDDDRALGAYPGPVIFTTRVYEFYYGVGFVNHTSKTLNSFLLSYHGEQWSDTTTNPQKLQFFYRIGNNDFTADNSSWTPLSSLNFEAPVVNGVGTELNGNSAANSKTIKAIIKGLSIPAGGTFWLRWFHGNQPGADPTLAVDDVVVDFCTVTNYQLTFKQPIAAKKPGKPLKFKGSKGFPYNVLIKTPNSFDTVEEVSYFAYPGTNAATNITFTTAGKLKVFTKGKNFKKGFKAMAKHKGKANKAGIGIAPGTSPVTLLTLIKGTQGGATGYFCKKQVFTNVQVK